MSQLFQIRIKLHGSKDILKQKVTCKHIQ